MKKIYLDYAAATAVDPAVLKTIQPYFSLRYYNPSAIYLAGREARSALQKTRASVARNLSAKPAEVIFTAGATEANNLAIQGLMKNYPDAEVLVSAIEHESVLAPAGLFKSKKIPVSRQGLVDLTALQKMISDRTVLVSVMMVNNEIGTVQPLVDIAKILNKSRKSRKTKLPLLFHTDAAQAPNYFDLSVGRLGVDLLSLNAGKIYGPKQSGALYVKAAVNLRPLILGGGQESGLRSGTENLAAAVGLAKALEITAKRRSSEFRRVQRLRDAFVRGLQSSVPAASVNGSLRHLAPHIVSATFEGFDNERLMMELDEHGIQVATGSACSVGSDEPSHVLTAIGLTEAQARSTLRFSFGRHTTLRDIMQTLPILSRLTS